MVKYKPADWKNYCFGLCQFCFWYNEKKNQCDLFAPIEEISDEEIDAYLK